jgi:hypothetical protein
MQKFPVMDYLRRKHVIGVLMEDEYMNDMLNIEFMIDIKMTVMIGTLHQ